MDPSTVLVLTIQLIALFSIAGALLLYLLCKVRGDATNHRPATNQHFGTIRSGSSTSTSAIGCSAIAGGSVLITSADTALGLQLCTHLAQRGCRVFAGLQDPVDSLPAKLLRGWSRMRMQAAAADSSTAADNFGGAIVLLRVDVTREDVLREATEAIGAHLNAGERGILAVINTAGSCCQRGRIEQQDSQLWERMFRTNVLGALRTARAFTALLRPTRGRLIFIGAAGGDGRRNGSSIIGNGGDGLVAFTAARVAVEGCAEALRRELQPYGIDVVALDVQGVPAEALFRAPMPFSSAIGKCK